MIDSGQSCFSSQNNILCICASLYIICCYIRSLYSSYILFLCRGKVPLKDLESLFPGMSGDFTSENFSAAWYLIENHSSTRLVRNTRAIQESIVFYFAFISHNVVSVLYLYLRLPGSCFYVC